MPQSLAALHVHLIFSTKDRAPFLIENVRADLHGYMAGILNEIDCHPIIINSMADHIHLLFDLARTVPVSRAVEAVKTGSSIWLKTRDPKLANFAWQSGYGAFASANQTCLQSMTTSAIRPSITTRVPFKTNSARFWIATGWLTTKNTSGIEMFRPFRAWPILSALT